MYTILILYLRLSILDFCSAFVEGDQLLGVLA